MAIRAEPVEKIIKHLKLASLWVKANLARLFVAFLSICTLSCLSYIGYEHRPLSLYPAQLDRAEIDRIIPALDKASIWYSLNSEKTKIKVLANNLIKVRTMLATKFLVRRPVLSSAEDLVTIACGSGKKRQAAMRLLEEDVTNILKTRIHSKILRVNFPPPFHYDRTTTSTVSINGFDLGSFGRTEEYFISCVVSSSYPWLRPANVSIMVMNGVNNPMLQLYGGSLRHDLDEMLGEEAGKLPENASIQNLELCALEAKKMEEKIQPKLQAIVQDKVAIHISLEAEFKVKEYSKRKLLKGKSYPYFPKKREVIERNGHIEEPNNLAWGGLVKKDPDTTVTIIEKKFVPQIRRLHVDIFTDNLSKSLIADIEKAVKEALEVNPDRGDAITVYNLHWPKSYPDGEEIIEDNPSTKSKSKLKDNLALTIVILLLLGSGYLMLSHSVKRN